MQLATRLINNWLELALLIRRLAWRVRDGRPAPTLHVSTHKYDCMTCREYSIILASNDLTHMSEPSVFEFCKNCERLRTFGWNSSIIKRMR
jgi:hypothetical protein